MEEPKLVKRMSIAAIQLSIVAVITVAGFVGGGLFANRSIDQIIGSVIPPKPSATPTPITLISSTPEPTRKITPTPTTTGPERTKALVTSVIDGDTIEVTTNGSVQKVRYIGIDAPKLAECYGKEAMEMNKSFVMGKEVILEKDTANFDGNGNLLRYVSIGEFGIAEYLVENGYAKAVPMPPNTAYQASLDHAAQKAQENKRGLWNTCEQVTPTPNY